MKHRLAVWLRRQANRLDPPPKIQSWINADNTFTNCTSSASAGWVVKQVKP